MQLLKSPVAFSLLGPKYSWS